MATHKVLLQEQLSAKTSQIEDILRKVSVLNLRINSLSQKFHSDASKLQVRIDRVQFSRPRVSFYFIDLQVFLFLLI